MTALLEATGLTKRFGAIVALAGFDLEAAAGEVVGLVGHNGAGKTTFARTVVGLITPDAGSLRINGFDIARKPWHTRSLVGLAPQDLGLYLTATARENLYLFAGLYGLRRRAAARRIVELSEGLLLSDVLDRRVRDLSGGQQRRLQAASAMLHRPRILLLDEPTVGADPVTRDALLATVRACAQDGAAVVYTTHYLPELETLGATLAIADQGRIIVRGDREQLLATVPGHAVIEFDVQPDGLGIAAIDSVGARWDNRRLTIAAPDPAATLAPLLAANPDAAAHLRTIELHQPTLDDLYRHLVRA